MSVLEELASWGESTHEISARASHAAKRVLMDQIGVSLSGGNDAPVISAGAPGATLWSTGESVYAPDAALANRFAGDDLELTAGPEIGAVSVATAEAFERTLGDVWVAMTVAAEVEHYAREWLQLAVERKGLHPPAVFAAMAAAAASAKLMGLAPPQFAGAMASAWALTPLSPYTAFSLGATGKWYYGAWSQRLGLQCALWAGAGIVGAGTTLEGRRGIAKALGVASPPPPFRPGRNAIADVTFKPYPCSRACHPALSALEKIEQQGKLEAATIEHVDVWSYPFSVELERRSAKRNPISSQMSISETLKARLATAAPVTVRSEGDDVLPRRRSARVEITLTDGTIREATSEAKWNANAPATDDEIRERFLDLTEGRRVLDPWLLDDDTLVHEAYRG